MSCSITTTDALELPADVDDDGPERLGLALREPGSGLVETEHARVEREQPGQLHHTARSGRQIGDVRVDVTAESEEVDEVVAVGPAFPFHADRTGQAERGGQQPGAVAPFERELDRLPHGELGEQRRGLERAAQPAPRPPRR